MIRAVLIAAATAASIPAAALGKAALPPVPVAPVVAASRAPARAQTQCSEDPAGAPHLAAKGRKALSTFGYMKQANDDPQGLARIQDQARQLRPQL